MSLLQNSDQAKQRIWIFTLPVVIATAAVRAEEYIPQTDRAAGIVAQEETTPDESLGEAHGLSNERPIKLRRPVKLKTAITTECLLACSPDGNSLVFGGGERELFGTIKLLDLQNKGKESTFRRDVSAIKAFAYSRSGFSLAVGEADGTVKVWNMPERTLMASLRGHSAPVSAVCFLTDYYTKLVSAARDGSIRIWSGLTLENCDTLQVPHGIIITCIASSPKFDYFVTGGLDEEHNTGELFLWSLVERKVARHFKGLHQPVRAVSFSEDGKHFLSAGGKTGDRPNAGELKLWNIDSAEPTKSFLGHVGPVSSATFCGRFGTTIASAGMDGELKFWSTASGEELLSIRPTGQPLNCVSWIPSRDLIATSNSSGNRSTKDGAEIWLSDFEALFRRAHQ